MAQTNLSWQTLRPAEGFYSSEVQLAASWPIRTFLPTGYEPNYPYPLLVFFHGHGGDEERVLRFAPRLSRRNYICISLRGPERVSAREDGQPTYGWGLDESAETSVEDYVMRAVEQTRRLYHVHSERVYLAGFHEGATLAYRMGLAFPERFAGVIALNGSLPTSGRPFARWHELRSLKVFIGHGLDNAIAPFAQARQDLHLLHTAGLSVKLHCYPTNHRIHTDMLRDVNRWVMSHVNGDD